MQYAGRAADAALPTFYVTFYSVLGKGAFFSQCSLHLKRRTVGSTNTFARSFVVESDQLDGLAR